MTGLDWCLPQKVAQNPGAYLTTESVLGFLIMLLQEIRQKIVSFLPQNSVDMIPVILEFNVVIFNKKIGTIDDVVVWLIRFETTYPSKVNFINT